MSRFVKPFLKAQRLNNRVTPSPFKERFLETSKEPSIPFPLFEKTQPKKIDLAHYMNLREGDLVEVLFGKDMGRHGIILRLNKKSNTAIVEGCNLERRRLLTKSDGNSSSTIVEIPIHVTNLALVDPVLKCPTRVKQRTALDGSSIRLCKISGSAMPQPVPRKQQAVNYNFFQEHQRLKSQGPPIKETYITHPQSHFQVLRRISHEILQKN